MSSQATVLPRPGDTFEQSFANRTQNYCLSRFKEMTSCHDALIEVAESHIVDSAVKSYWMAYILISGHQIKLDFKVHYSSKEMFALMSQVFEESSSKVSTALVDDCMKEYCNLTAGAIKLMLKEAEIDCGFSIPLVTRGFDEIWFKKLNEDDILQFCWKISWSGGHVYISVACHLADWSMLSYILPNEPSYDDSGDMEFL